MIAFLISASAVATMALQGAPAAAPIDLFCVGRGDRFVTRTTKVRMSDGSVKDKSESMRVPFNNAIRIKIAGDSGQALIPDAMLGDDEARGWHEIKKLAVSPAAISGKIYFGWLFSPVMTLDRATRILKVSGSMANFSGNCSPYDARTSVLPRAAAPRPSAPLGDQRAGARAAAQQADGRAAARSAAMKADLAFRLFNAGSSPIAEMVMIGATRVPSKNWLATGGALAPNGFRNMNFAKGGSCTLDVRVSFANGARVTRPIDFCGKDVLYASGSDLWAE